MIQGLYPKRQPTYLETSYTIYNDLSVLSVHQLTDRTGVFAESKTYQTQDLSWKINEIKCPNFSMICDMLNRFVT